MHPPFSAFAIREETFLASAFSILFLWTTGLKVYDSLLSNDSCQIESVPCKRLAFFVCARLNMFAVWSSAPWSASYDPEVVILHPEETQHFPIWSTGQDGELQWNTTHPANGGFVSLPDGKGGSQVFDVAMFHQLRCLGDIRSAMEANQTDFKLEEDANLMGCSEYLRKVMFCHSDLTLEAAVGAELLLDITSPHICRDWTLLYDRFH